MPLAKQIVERDKMKNITSKIKRAAQISLVIPLSALVIGGCSTKEVSNVPYQGYSATDEGSYNLAFDEKTIYERNGPAKILAEGDPKMKTEQGDSLVRGQRYNVQVRDYWPDFISDKILKVEEAKDSTER